MVLDPFFGSGTVGEVCLRLKRRFVGIELKREYAGIAAKRLHWQRTEGASFPQTKQPAAMRTETHAHTAER
jgi:DNA modification methylase